MAGANFVWIAVLDEADQVYGNAQTAPDLNTVMIWRVDCTLWVEVSLQGCHTAGMSTIKVASKLPSENILDVRPNALLQANFGMLGNVRFGCATAYM